MTTILERRNIAYKEAETLVGKALAGDEVAAKAASAKLDEVEDLDRLQTEYIKSSTSLARMAGTSQESGKTLYLNPKAFAVSAAKGIRDYSKRVGATKSIAPAGDVDTVQVTSNLAVPSTAGLERPTRLIEYLPVLKRPAIYNYLAQKFIEDPGAAAIVPKGGLKPTKKLGLEKVDNKLVVVAVMSEPVDIFEMQDTAGLEQWVNVQLAEALFDEIERQVFYGDGTEGFNGLDTSTGVLAQGFVTDKLVTIMHGLGRLQALGIKPEKVVLNATDWLTIQTNRNASGAFDVGGPVDSTAQTVWGIPVIVATGVVAGEGWVIGEDALQLGSDESGGQAKIAWREVGEDFQRNQIRARVEMRASSDLIKPYAIVKLDLAA